MPIPEYELSGAQEVRDANPSKYSACLDEVSKPILNYPYDFIQSTGPFGMSGTTINGLTSPVFHLAPQKDSERYEGVLGAVCVVRRLTIPSEDTCIDQSWFSEEKNLPL